MSEAPKKEKKGGRAKGTVNKSEGKARGFNIKNLEKWGYPFKPPIPATQFGGDVYALRLVSADYKVDGKGKAKKLFASKADGGLYKSLTSGRLYHRNKEETGYIELTEEEYDSITKEYGEKKGLKKEDPKSGGVDVEPRIGTPYQGRKKDEVLLKEEDSGIGESPPAGVPQGPGRGRKKGKQPRNSVSDFAVQQSIALMETLNNIDEVVEVDELELEQIRNRQRLANRNASKDREVLMSGGGGRLVGKQSLRAAAGEGVKGRPQGTYKPTLIKIAEAEEARRLADLAKELAAIAEAKEKALPQEMWEGGFRWNGLKYIEAEGNRDIEETLGGATKFEENLYVAVTKDAEEKDVDYPFSQDHLLSKFAEGGATGVEIEDLDRKNKFLAISVYDGTGVKFYPIEDGEIDTENEVKAIEDGADPEYDERYEGLVLSYYYNVDYGGEYRHLLEKYIGLGFNDDLGEDGMYFHEALASDGNHYTDTQDEDDEDFEVEFEYEGDERTYYFNEGMTYADEGQNWYYIRYIENEEGEEIEIQTDVPKESELSLLLTQKLASRDDEPEPEPEPEKQIPKELEEKPPTVSKMPKKAKTTRTPAQLAASKAAREKYAALTPAEKLARKEARAAKKK